MSSKIRPPKPHRLLYQTLSKETEKARTTSLPIPAATLTRINWQHNQQDFCISTTQQGRGPRALLLPSLSPISTIKEMEPLQRQLSDNYSTLAVDWPGFGDTAQSNATLSTEILDAWLQHVVAVLLPRAKLVVAAGHAAGYVLRLVAHFPDLFEKIVLIAPTYLGPLVAQPGYSPLTARIIRRILISFPVNVITQRIISTSYVLQQVIYANRFSSKEADLLWLAQKKRVLSRSGSIFATSTYWTGLLDPYSSEKEWSQAALPIAEKLKVMWGNEISLPQRRAMIALARISKNKPLLLSRGKIHLHEEFPTILAHKIVKFATQDSTDNNSS